jgi:hypothetical protein
MFKTQVTATELKEKLYNSISADTEKAFFMILNALLIKSVSKVGIKKFLNLLKIIYIKADAYIVFNCEKFQISHNKGRRQGHSLSTHFHHCAGSLANAGRQIKETRGTQFWKEKWNHLSVQMT